METVILEESKAQIMKKGLIVTHELIIDPSTIESLCHVLEQTLQSGYPQGQIMKILFNVTKFIYI